MRAFSRTAIIFFSLSPEEEARRKTILKGFSLESNERLFRLMDEKCAENCEETELPFYRFDERLQRGTGFGQRFCNAIEDAFDFGYERLIVIGNDSPDISSEDMLTAARGLEEGHSLLWPSSNGGFSMLAIRREDYNRMAFSKVKWNSAEAYTSMRTALGAGCEIGEEYLEVNTYVDLIDYVNSTNEFSALLDYARSIVAPFYVFNDYEDEPITVEMPKGIRFRGPPFKA